jgi:hypothetical protein
MSKEAYRGTYARLYNPGDLPVKVDCLIVYGSEGEDRSSFSPITIAPGEYKDIPLFCRPGRGEDIRLYAYSEKKEIAKFEGKIT